MGRLNSLILFLSLLLMILVVGSSSSNRNEKNSEDVMMKGDDLGVDYKLDDHEIKRKGFRSTNNEKNITTQQIESFGRLIGYYFSHFIFIYLLP